MKKISTRNAILAGIFGWVSFLLADSICFTLLTMKVFLAAGGGCLCAHRRHGGALDFL